MNAAIELDASQQAAVNLMCDMDSRISIVTGGPGTGKTTTLRVALDAFDARNVRYELAAPTGKASKRIQETTGRRASTIHRLLRFSPNNGWGYNAFEPVPTDVIVIDESSMVDVELGAALLRAIGPRTRLVMIGDADQLPPVGPGRIFGDLVESAAVPVARLNTLHRSAQESWIHRNAPVMLRGEMPELGLHKDFRFIEIEDSANILPAVCKLITETIPKEIDADAQVLIPQRPGVAGIDAANRLLQNAINPRTADSSFVPRKEFELRIGDRVIQTKNDYNLGVFNGEIGDIIDIASGAVVVNYLDREPVKYSLEQSNGLQLAYALTVHRSQGSEFPWIVVVCHSTHTYILTRQLIYTAVTRAKQGVILVGNEKGLRAALSDKKPPKRNTALIERLRLEIAA